MSGRPSTLTAAATARSASPAVVVAALAFAGCAGAMTSSMLFPVLPRLPELLDTDLAAASWLSTSTLIVASVSNPVFGRLADQFGRRRMLLMSLGLLGAGSVVCAFASSMPVLLVGRCVQGTAAAVVPIGISVARDVLSPTRARQAAAMMSATWAVGNGVGLPLAGLLADRADWHALFWVSFALAAVSYALVARTLPETATTRNGRFDLAGALCLSLALVAGLLPLSKAAAWGWTSATTLGLFAAAAVLGVLWARGQARHPAPIVDLALLRTPALAVVHLVSFLLGFAWLVNFLATLTELQQAPSSGHGFGLSSLAVGVWLAPTALLALAVAPFAGRGVERFGARTVLVGGSLVAATGLLLRGTVSTSVLEVAIGAALFNAGTAVALGAVPAVIMAWAPSSSTASVNSVNTVVRTVGGAVAGAATGLILSAMTTDGGAPSVTAYRAAFFLAGGTALAAAVAAVLLPVRDDAVDAVEAVA